MGNAFRQPKVYNPRETDYPPVSRRKKIPKLFLAVLLLIIILIGGGYLLYYSSFFEIKKIIINGQLKPEIEESLFKLKGENIIFFSPAKYEKEISQKFPEISDFQMIRGLPDTLKINFQDQTPKLVWETQEKLYLVEGHGKIFKESSEFSSLPVVKDNKDLSVNLGQQVVSENFENFVLALFNDLPPIVNAVIDHFEINDTIFQVDAKTSSGLKIIFDTTRSAADQLTDLETFLLSYKNEAKEYIDLRVEGRVYYQ